jgi:hypothetical protein
MAYGRNFYPDQQVFIGQLGSSVEELKGVQSFDGGWSVPYEQMMAAGHDYIGNEVNGELVGEVSVSRSIVSSEDPVTGLLNGPVSGYLVYGTTQSYDKVFNFNRGYITSYDSSCSLGDVASCDFGLTAYGGIGKISNESRSYTAITPTVATANNIAVTTDFGSTNAIQSYSLSIAFDRAPVNKIGESFSPTDFTTNLPVVANVSFDFLVNDFEAQNVRESICGDFTSNLILALNTCPGSNIRTFTLNNASLLDTSLQAGIGDNMTVSVTYDAYYNSVTGAVDAILS